MMMTWNPRQSSVSLLRLNWQVEFEFRRKLLLRVETIRKVDAANPTVGMDLQVPIK